MQRTLVLLAVATTLAIAPALVIAQTAGQTAPQSASMLFVPEQRAGEVLAYRLGGTRVFNSKGEIIGQVNDVVLDANGQAVSAVIGVGGFLGVGTKSVAVPYRELKIGPVIEGSRVLLLNVTRDQLQGAPTYKATDPSRTDRAGTTAAKWAKIAKEKAIELGQQASEAAKGLRERMSTPAPAPAPSGSAPAPAPTPPPAAAPAPAVK